MCYCHKYLSVYKTHVGSAPEMVTRRIIAGSVMSTTHLANPVTSTNGHSCTSAKFCNWKQYNVGEKALQQRMEYNYQRAVEVATAVTDTC